MRHDKNKKRETKSVVTRKSMEIRTAAPLFLPATKNSKLLTMFKAEMELMGKTFGWRYKMVERSGRMLREMLTRSNIF